MRHRKAGRKFGRNNAHRAAMLRNLVSNLLQHGQVKTTVAKAKEARRIVDRCITYAKKGIAAASSVGADVVPLRSKAEELKDTLKKTTDEAQIRELRKQIVRNGRKINALTAKGEHFRRLLMRRLHRQEIVEHLWNTVAPKYTTRPGGFTRIMRAGFRLGDKAEIAVFQLV